MKYLSLILLLLCSAIGWADYDHLDDVIVDNIIVRGDMEDGFGNWEFSGTTGALSITDLQVVSLNFATASMVTGGADSIVVDFTPDLTLQAGTTIYFVAEASNTGAATLILDGVEDTINEASDNSALEAGDINNTSVTGVMFDGTNWQQFTQSGN